MRRGGGVALALALASLSALPASAKEDTYLLSTGGGVSDPSALQGLRDNPAGFSQLERVKIQALALTSSSQFNPITGGAHLLLGNGWIGGGLGLELTVPGALSPSLFAGLGIHIKPIKTALGLACAAGIGGGISISCSQLGFLFNPEGVFRVGLETSLSGILGGSFPIGTGVAVDLFKIFTLSVDASTQIGGFGAGGFTVLPAAGLHAWIVDLQAGYGFAVLGAGGGSLLRTGFTAGGGVALGKVIYLTVHHNHLATWFTSITARL